MCCWHQIEEEHIFFKKLSDFSDSTFVQFSSKWVYMSCKSSHSIFIYISHHPTFFGNTQKYNTCLKLQKKQQPQKQLGNHVSSKWIKVTQRQAGFWMIISYTSLLEFHHVICPLASVLWHLKNFILKENASYTSFPYRILSFKWKTSTWKKP